MLFNHVPSMAEFYLTKNETSTRTSSCLIEADDLGTTLDELKNRGLSNSPLTHFTRFALVLLVLVIFKPF